MRARLLLAVTSLGALASCASGGSSYGAADVSVVYERSAVAGCESKGMLSPRRLFATSDQLDPAVAQEIAARGANTLLIEDRGLGNPDLRIYDCARETVRTVK